MTQNDHYFLGLPAELRNGIYEYVFCLVQPETKTSSVKSAQNACGTQDQPAFLQVCCQVLQEPAGFYYSSRSFQLKRARSLERFSHALDPSLRSHNRSIAVDVDFLEIMDEPCRVLRRIPSLRRLTLVISQKSILPHAV